MNILYHFLFFLTCQYEIVPKRWKRQTREKEFSNYACILKITISSKIGFTIDLISILLGNILHGIECFWRNALNRRKMKLFSTRIFFLGSS